MMTTSVSKQRVICKVLSILVIEQKNKQIEIFQKKFTAADIYREINTPLTIVSVIVAPSPINVIKLAKIAKEQADEKKARILAAASFGTGEDELGAGDYVDPRIFERTMKVLNAIQVKDIESKNAQWSFVSLQS